MCIVNRLKVKLHATLRSGGGRVVRLFDQALECHLERGNSYRLKIFSYRSQNFLKDDFKRPLAYPFLSHLLYDWEVSFRHSPSASPLLSCAYISK